MDLKARFKNLDRGEIVEVVHLLTRHLLEIRNRDDLKRIIAVDSQGGAAVEAAVFGLVDEIEEAEGARIEMLGSEVRAGYVKALDSRFWKEVESDLPSRSEVDSALARLREAS